MAKQNAPEKNAKTPSAREARLKAALKANMARRKAQARARAEDVAQDTGNGPEGPEKDS
ncbi:MULTISPECIES: hypothetical protein [Sulfitobacter]|jgi:hypothetical protein|uniref:Uncharacterized protein n=1 Tax=Sulfitobacter faviae TaxID=1775881 RepID=A0AAX3LQ76_9RHOB|nr:MULTISPECIES: hypothetical protein [Sulfitobacter]NKX41475.1 hypothetical protein [Rhodobacteraceae bacterium R_SAG2]MBO9429506.1 hypothetical protein [Sulfitobacter sp. R18_1]MBO9440000.1 hypothetical protein [Sulfitobacter sp. R18_2]MDF3351693.1 hypothetical protein [Sulfitobacter sp. KE12]MDF3355365.1 hypothetical protein [Sulfitobacter sp. KE27]|tara:strand:+ start:147 stop:323 length:177 start_codon:yes stop_codon:yes gene_type:complete